MIYSLKSYKIILLTGGGILKEYTFKAPVKAEKYRRGMEDGWLLYYSYENYSYDIDSINNLMLFRSLSALEQRKKEMAESQDENNPIIFEEPVPVIKTIHGIRRVLKDDYVVVFDNNIKMVLDKNTFHILFEQT